LEIGISVARGHAWRLDFSHGVDYAGSVVNLTSRLLDYARPQGVVIQYLMSQALCDGFIDSGDGKLAKVSKLKGFPSGVDVWLSPEVDLKQEGIALTQKRSSRKQFRSSSSRKTH
jgi:class 3 adenylate cyclase